VFFTKYTRAGASSRYRSFQYLSAPEAAGLRFTVSPLFDDAYLAHKFAHGRARIGDVLRAYARRLLAVLTVPRAAVVVIEYELLPWFPAVLERLLAWRGCQMVVDYDDALFHQYDTHPNPWVRGLLGRKIATVMRLAHTVVAGNAYLADYALRAGARRMVVIPTVIDLLRYPVVERAHHTEVFTIGWIGSPSTARYLHGVAPALAQVCADGRAKVRLIGAGSAALSGVPVDAIPWREETEVDEIRRCDVGIMPLPDEPWARGKCGFKLIQYMACGLPVLASPVGVNQQIVEHGVNGFLAQTPQEWVTALDTLRNDPALRARMGAAGRRKVETTYCLQVTAPQYVSVLRQAAGLEEEA
jgi:glycosyltransferase involved in cell wall biosynthesis